MDNNRNESGNNGGKARPYSGNSRNQRGNDKRRDDRPRRDNRSSDDRGGRNFERRDDKRGGGRNFERRDDNRGGGRSFERRDDNRGGGRSFERRDDNRGGGRSFERRDDNRGGGRSFERRDDNRGGGRSFERRDDNRGGGRSFERRDDNRGGGRSFERRDDNRGGGRSFERRDEYRGRRDYDDELKQTTQLDDEGYRSGVSAAGMFVKPKYNKKFAVNADKLTDPEAMSDAGKAEVIEGIREDRLEGRNPIREALTAGRTIDKLWVLKPQEDGRFDKTVAELIRDVKDQGGIIMEVEKSALDRLSITHSHQGVIAQTAVHDYVEVQDILDRAKEKGEDPLVIILDEIKDAYNLGSIFRIADAAGAHGIIIPKRRSVGLDAIVAKASAGAIEHVPCARVTNLVNTMKELKEAGLWIAGTAIEGSSKLSESDLSGPMAVVIGSEGEGMRDLVQKNCDLLVNIPMKGQVNSLNAAVAAGIVIFEAARQRDTKATTTTEG